MTIKQSIDAVRTEPVRENHFNLIRLSAALMVFVGHCFPLTMGESLSNSPVSTAFASIAAIGVDIFFAVSGFLVMQSLLRSTTLGGFAWRRAVRIYPGLFVSVAFCTLVVGPAFTTMPLPHYFGSSETLSFALGKASIVGLFFTGGGSDLPGVFTTLPFPNSVNASLWTLPWEALMYTLLAGIAVACQRPKNYELALRLTVVTALVCFLLTTAWTQMRADSASVQAAANPPLNPALRFGSLFFTGAWLGLTPSVLRPGATSITVLLLLCAFVCLYIGGIAHVGYLFAVAIVVIRLGVKNTPKKLLQVNKIGDYSYGIYIFAFPIQQSVVSITGTESPAILALISLPFLAAAALFSWHCIEAPCLKAKSAVDGSRLALFTLRSTEQTVR